MNGVPLNRLAFLVVAFVLFTGLISGQSPEPTKTPSEKTEVTANQRETIEVVVREYLLKHPEVIREAIDALQANDEKASLERGRAALISHKDEIYSDPEAPVAGNPKGDVTVVVFFDYNCGYCRSNLPVLQDLVAKDKMLRVIYKEFPILGPGSEIAAHAALAAGRQGKYEDFHNALFGMKSVTDAQIKLASTRLGMNYLTLRSDMASVRIKENIRKNLALADALGIDGTPSYIIGGSVVSGAIGTDRFTEMIAAERAKFVKPEPAKASGEPKE